MTAPVNQFNSGTHANIQTLVNAITAVLPTSVPGPIAGQPLTFSGFDFSEAKSFRITLEVTPDGQSLVITSKSGDQGQNNAFGPTDGGPAGHYQRQPAIVIPGALI
jgi:hypothetical protein